MSSYASRSGQHFCQPYGPESDEETVQAGGEGESGMFEVRYIVELFKERMRR